MTIIKNQLPPNYQSYIQFLEDAKRADSSILNEVCFMFHCHRMVGEDALLEAYEIDVNWIKAKCYDEMQVFLNISLNDWREIRSAVSSFSYRVNSPIQKKIHKAMQVAALIDKP